MGCGVLEDTTLAMEKGNGKAKGAIGGKMPRQIWR